METLILTSKKKLRPTVRNILRAIALENNFTLVFKHTQDTSFILSHSDKIKQVDRNGYIYSLDNLLDELECDLKKDEGVDKEIIKKIQFFFSDTAMENELERLYKIVNFTVEQLSSYKFDGKTTDLELVGFYEKWKSVYKDLKDFVIDEKVLVNKINKSETGEYQKAFEKIGREGIAPSIQNAIASLIDSIPEDVEKLLDIGAGPGYVDEALPEDIQVLAMDIDEKILEGNPRPYCIGDVLQIPLKDNSVDMTITCDMLEHIEPEELPKACDEIKRVSKKYIYIQVPYRENLLAGYAYCDKCGMEWHVNYHKSCFDEEKVIRLFGKGWIPVRINYTGECKYDYNLKKEFQFLSDNGIKCNRIVNWTCPKCGGTSTSRSDRLPDLLMNLEKNDRNIFPQYSEVAVLFIKEEYFSEYRHSETIKNDMVKMYKNVVNFSDVYEIVDIVSPYNLRPTVFSRNKCIKNKGKVCVFKNVGEIWGCIGVVFPLWFNQDDRIEIKGCSGFDCQFVLCSATIEGKEIRIGNIEVEGGNFKIELPCPTFVLGNRALIKLYFSAEEIDVYSVQIIRKYKEEYARINLKEVKTFYNVIKQNIQYSYVVKGMDVLDMSTENTENGNKLFADALRKNEYIIGKLQEELAQLKDVVSNIQPNRTNEEDKEEEMVKNAGIILELEENKLSFDEEDERAEQEQILKDLLFSFYEEPDRQHGKNQKVWAKKKFDQLIGWVYRKPVLYNLVIKCGAKNIYAKFLNWRQKKI